MDCVINELCYEGQFNNEIIGKLPFYDHFPLIPL